MSDAPFAGTELVQVLLASALATFLSEDLACAAVGALVGQGRLGFVPGVLACGAGILAGDLLLFLAGRWFGAWALARAPLRWFLSPERVAQASAWLARRGATVVFVSRFVPGTRLPTYFASGALGMRLAPFTLWFTLAAVLWTPLVVGLAAGVGAGLAARVRVLRASGILLAAATLAVVALLLRSLRRLATARGRGLLQSRWRRATRFEYWPAWLLYLPLVPHLAWLALRHGGLRTCTLANPALPLGGLVGESKGAILAALAASGRVPPTERLPASLTCEQRRAAVRAFQRRHDAGFPLVLKPDIGERGRGVVVARSQAEVEHALAAADGALLAQAFVPGPEFGIFYARAPDEPRGRILSLAEKRLPRVTGDGRSTLEELILADERTLGMARYFLAAHAHDLARVPRSGESVALGDLGTHCRGATFLDASELATPALAEAVERVSRALPGFHFGRFDVRAESVEALRAGRFLVLELNGLTSESAHIYDPRHSVARAWRDLGRQWRLAFEIGAACRGAGAVPDSWSAIGAALREHHRHARMSGSREAPAAAGTSRSHPVTGSRR